MKIGLFFPFTFYAWMYTSVRKGMTKGMFSVILRLFDVVEYLLDVHDATTKKAAEKQDREKEESVKDKSDTDIMDCLDSNLNHDKKPKLYDTDYVSFTVAAAQTQLKSDISEVVTFDQVITNEGDGYDSNNGKFSCPMSGVYVFFYSSTNGDENMISLVQDGHRVDASLYGGKRASKDGEQVSHMAMLQLKQNHQVWLNCTKDIDVDITNLQFATFSGFLLYEQ